eukprot:CAMPEP_0203713812 /NCGR_PEP_ID=MMETSP0091-20130426/70757_1 /ASSEMBLY_ACC=CAM_ASM_001089 /TAXON_ID=426623 /ORGANISM="Chaetoceros affinis, Strain CCMP159" /LENGTH=70 /DNA_ID=CAMNT_0050591849 /DNA_START=929 /DNA_END=1141 /DNA_ORIENTATION=-
MAFKRMEAKSASVGLNLGLTFLPLLPGSLSLPADEIVGDDGGNSDGGDSDGASLSFSTTTFINRAVVFES